MTAQEHHISLDAPIRRILASGGGGSSKSASADPCPSPEMFAAYYEHSLDPEETERYDAHIAGCASCRATLAGVARASVGDDAILDTDRDRLRESRWNWRRLSLWLVPAAAAACAVFIALALHQRSSATHEKTAEVAELRSAAPPASEPLPIVPPPAGAANAPITRSREAVPAAAQPSSSRARQPLPEMKMAPEASKKIAPGAAPSPPALSTVETAELAQDASSAATVEVTPSDAKSAGAHPTPPRAPRDARQQSMQSFSASAVAPMMKARATAGAQQQTKDHLTITSPDSSITWTIHTNHVQYTENGKAAPVQDFLPTNSAIAAGSAPGGNVCWLVGSGGAVVRTTDGHNWLAATPPTSADLTAVTAQNAKSATVTAADGKKYATADGGLTWKASQ